MGLFDRVERTIERAVKAPFARAFRSEVQPVEIASALRGAMDDRAVIIAPGRTIVPNQFVVELSDTDFDRLSSYSDVLTDELVASAAEHADSQRYTPGGPVAVELACASDLETGVFRLRPATARDVGGHRGRPPRRAPAPATRQRSPQPHPPQPIGPVAADQTRAFTSPADAPRPGAGRGPRPWLDLEGDRYPLGNAITVLGRDASADVVLDDPGISRQHSEIRVTADGPHLLSSIRDLGSTNGTFVNGDRVQTRRLAEGDRITLGRTSLVFRNGGRR